MQETLFMKLRRAIPRAEFQPPATVEQIAAAEEALGIKMPEWLRELFLACNGFGVPGYSYLDSIETLEDLKPVSAEIEYIRGKYTQGLIGTNLFLRDLWNDNLDLLVKNRPEIDWRQWDVHKLLIISTVDTQNWAIYATGERSILLYYTRADEWTIEGKNLIAACIKHEREVYKAREHVFRGRRQYRPVAVGEGTIRDIDRVLHALPDISLDQAISQRPHERGELYITHHVHDIHVRIATRDGNFPFVMRFRINGVNCEPSCTVATMRQVIRRFRMLSRYLNRKYRWDGSFQMRVPTPDARELEHLWKDGAERSDAELEAMMTILSKRDERRLREPNPFGG